MVKQTLKAQGEEIESESDDEEEIREVVGGENKLPVPGAGSLGISDEQLAAMPPEVQARVRAAQALAAKMAAGPPPPPAPTGLPGAAVGWRPGMPLPGVPGAAAAAPAAQLPAVIPASAFKAQQPGAAAPAVPGVIPAAAFKPQQPAAGAPGAAPAAEVNPILAAAQAAARRLAEQAGMPAAAAAPAAGAVPGAAPVAPASLLQQMLPPGGVAPATAGAASAVLQQMMGPGGALPGAPGTVPGVLPGMPGAVPGAVPGVVPGAVPGVLPGAPGVEQPAKHFETELVINDFPQHARWKVRVMMFGMLARPEC